MSSPSIIPGRGGLGIGEVPDFAPHRPGDAADASGAQSIASIRACHSVLSIPQYRYYRHHDDGERDKENPVIDDALKRLKREDNDPCGHNDPHRHSACQGTKLVIHFRSLPSDYSRSILRENTAAI